MGGRLAGSLLLVFAAAAGVTGVGACTSASGEVSGGEWRAFDAAAPERLDIPVTEPTFANAGDTTWRGLYRDFFGKRAPSSCAGNGTCHGTPTQAGASQSGFVCADVDGCWQSLRTAKHRDPRVLEGAMVEEAAIAAPESALLFKVLRYRNADNVLLANLNMPQSPADFYFQNAEILRMQAWIRAGANND